MKFILGKKIGMSQVFDKEGRVIPVTLIEAGPCFVTQIKTKDRDGYEAAQVGFGHRKKLTKPILGHLKKLGQFKWLKEFRIMNHELGIMKKSKVGDEIGVDVFKEGDTVKISGISKGKGFAGVMKRHGFKGMPASHGTKHTKRAPGSIGTSWPERVPKGRRMAGRMGTERVTIKNLEVVKVDKENNLLAIKGAIPGRKGTLVEVRG